jgi:hypothetical protein
MSLAAMTESYQRGGLEPEGPTHGPRRPRPRSDDTDRLTDVTERRDPGALSSAGDTPCAPCVTRSQHSQWGFETVTVHLADA